MSPTQSVQRFDEGRLLRWTTVGSFHPIVQTPTQDVEAVEPVLVALGFDRPPEQGGDTIAIRGVLPGVVQAHPAGPEAFGVAGHTPSV